MSLVEFKKKKKPKNKVIMGIIIFILLLIIVSGVRYIYGLGFRTTTPTPDILLDKINGTGLVIKSEKVYDSTGSGDVEYIVEEGKKVPVGQEIVSVSSGNSDILSQLDEIEKQIDELDIDYYSEEEDFSLLEDIQKKINEGNYNDINEYLGERNNSEGNTNLVASNLETLLSKQKDLKNLLNDSRKTNVTEDSGILSYEIDGFEETLKPQDFENYSYESIDFNKIQESMKESETLENVTGGTPVYKIIDDYIWYIALKVDDERILELEEGQAYDVQLDDDTVIGGKIVKINANDSKGVIVIEFNDGLYEFYGNRIMDIALIKSNYRSFEVPTRSIIQKDGQDGVYINHVYGIVRFMPVNVLYVDDEEKTTYVEQGNNEGYIDIEGEEVRTITEFDEIFLNPFNVEENQILR